MHLAIDALPINNFSGRNVLTGHLCNLARNSGAENRITVFHHAGNRDLRRDLGSNVDWIECEAVSAAWPRRLVWQLLCMNRKLRAIGADMLLSTSGALVPGVKIPQIVLAQNPWCFFPQFHQTAAERLKAKLQRAGYRRAQKTAEAMFYLSDYMAKAYAALANCPPRHGATVLVGVDDRYYQSAAANPPDSFERRALEVLSVSVMTPHKNIEGLLDAFTLLRDRGVTAQLTLVGPWASVEYRARIEERIAKNELTARVVITGQVSDAELEQHYRRARVFCLLSRCESFGIPAVEAQVFGTPSVVAGVCAPPEIAGPGGEVVPDGDHIAAADSLHRLLTNARVWGLASSAAVSNADRFKWPQLTGSIKQFLHI